MPRHCFSRLKHHTTTLRPLLSSALNTMGRPGRFWRCGIWSLRSGIVVLTPRARSHARLAFDGYPLSPRNRSGRSRGRPVVETRICLIAAGSMAVSTT